LYTFFETPVKLWFFSVKFFGICIKFAGLFPDRKIRAEQWLGFLEIISILYLMKKKVLLPTFTDFLLV
jgi:hypothetical protein